MAGEAFDAMFDDDQQLVALTQREDRVIERCAGLQQWFLARDIALDSATARPGRIGGRRPGCQPGRASELASIGLGSSPGRGFSQVRTERGPEGAGGGISRSMGLGVCSCCHAHARPSARGFTWPETAGDV